MKKSVSFSLYLTAAFFGFLFLSGCLKDSCRNTYKIFSPVYNTLTQVRAGMRSGQPHPLEQTGKIYLYGQYIFLNEVNKGIHVIDNSDPAQPKNISFINIPGNVDLAVKGSSLYADCYSDLAVFDISNPVNITATKFVDKVFPYRGSMYQSNSTNPDSIMVIVGYIQKDTTVDCETYNSWLEKRSFAQDASGASFSTAAPTKAGQGGSMARFTIVNDYLYSVSNSQLKAFNISTAADPQLSNTKNIGWDIETIYPFSNKLFIGSATGMFIYDVTNPGNPSYVSQFSHIRRCDPVIADGVNAYVTLRSGTTCGGAAINELQVLNITNLSQPKLVKTYPMTNPHGLSKDGAILFICDGKGGVKVYNALDVTNLKLVKTIPGLDTYDVIANNGIALVVAKDGLYQFDYSKPDDIKQISKITIAK